MIHTEECLLLVEMSTPKVHQVISLVFILYMQMYIAPIIYRLFIANISHVSYFIYNYIGKVLVLFS